MVKRFRRVRVNQCWTYLAVEDGTTFLELVEKIFILDIAGQVAHEHARVLIVESLLPVVASDEWRGSIVCRALRRRLVDGCSRIAHYRNDSHS